jgi:hypothetical protein
MQGYIPQGAEGEPPDRESGEGGPLVTPRQAGILGASLLIAAVGGYLTYLIVHSMAGAVLAGGTTFAAAIQFLHRMIGR